MHKYDGLIREVEARFQAGEHLSYYVFMEGGMPRTTAHRTMQRMHTDGQIHVHHYVRNPDGQPSVFFAWGAGKDAPKLRTLTKAERTRRYRRNNPDRYVRDVSRQRARQLKAKPPVFDPLMRALMGV